jgi:hypothetical protein
MEVAVEVTMASIAAVWAPLLARKRGARNCTGLCAVADVEWKEYIRGLGKRVLLLRMKV